MNLPITHNTAAHCFEVTVDGHRCVIDYVLHKQVMTVMHTGVPEELGGRGIAAALTQHMLEAARAAGWKVIPACTYTAAYLRKHPEFAALSL
jgi:predicted GNAT family acetyltransferase